MISGNILIAFFLTKYILFFISILNSNNKEKLKLTNTRIEFLRQKPMLTMEEQKEFILLKYKQDKMKVKFDWVSFIKNTLISMGIFFAILLPLRATEFRPSFFLILLINIILAWIINWILRKWNLHQQNGLDVLFR